MAKHTYKIVAGGDLQLLRKGKLDLQEKWREVDGYIEIVKAVFDGKTCDMIINEEGKIHNLPVNIKATFGYNEALGIINPDEWVDVINGDVLVEMRVKETK